MKTVCIVQARMGSTRLPGKVLLPLNGHTVIEEVLTRCKKIPGVDAVVCAVPQTDENTKIAELADKHCFYVFGPEHDVLRRYLIAANETRADIIVRVTGDCPLISPTLCGRVVELLKDSGAAYSSNIEPRTFPQGFDCEAFTIDTLRAAHENAEDHEREHVTTWMRRANIRRVNVASPWRLEGRLTLDTWDDYQTIRASFNEHLRAA